MTSIKVSQKGSVVIPVELRRKYGVDPGDEVQVVDYGGVLSLIPVREDPVDIAAGMMRGETSLTDALVEEREKGKNARNLTQDIPNG